MRNSHFILIFTRLAYSHHNGQSWNNLFLLLRCDSALRALLYTEDIVVYPHRWCLAYRVHPQRARRRFEPGTGAQINGAPLYYRETWPRSSPFSTRAPETHEFYPWIEPESPASQASTLAKSYPSSLCYRFSEPVQYLIMPILVPFFAIMEQISTWQFRGIMLYSIFLHIFSLPWIASLTCWNVCLTLQWIPVYAGAQ